MRVSNIRNIIVFAVFFSNSVGYAADNTTAAKDDTLAIIQQELDDFLAKEMQQYIAGSVVLISQNGNTIYKKAHGFADLAQQDPMTTESIFRIYSMTKPITSVGILLLVERGIISLDDSVDKFIPELADLEVFQWGKNTKPTHLPTIRELLTHTSGFSYGIFEKNFVDFRYLLHHPLFASSPEDFVERVRRLPLASSPSEKWRYSVSTDVLGIVIERVTGMSLADFLQQEIFLPLDMQDTSFVVPADKVPRFTTMYTKKIFGTSLKVKEQREESSYLHTPPFYMGGAGLVSTVDDYYKFCSMLLEDGYYPTANGPQQLLQTETIEAMLHNQLPDGIKIKEEYGFGYGVIIKTEKPGHTHEGEVNWDGIGSTHFWMLPEQDVVVIALSQYQPFSKRLFQGLHTILYDLPMTETPPDVAPNSYPEPILDDSIAQPNTDELPRQEIESE